MSLGSAAVDTGTITVDTEWRDGASERRDGVPIAESLLRDTLAPYAVKGCRYLQRATYKVSKPAAHWVVGIDDPSSTGQDGDLSASSICARGEFSITASSYIQDTGHFNAAEFVMSYNQLFYCMLAQSIDKSDIPELVDWTTEDFYSKQLPNILIQKQSSEYFAPIDARRFFGEIRIVESRLVERRHTYVRLETEVSFWDAGGVGATEACRRTDGGHATGQVTIAILLDTSRDRAEKNKHGGRNE